MKLVKEYINEKFTDESDPVHDMGIGVNVKRNFKTEKELLQFVWDILPAIFGGSIPEDILYNIKDTGFFKDYSVWSKVENYVHKYITLNNNDYFFTWDINNAFHNALMRKGFKISKAKIEYWKQPQFKDNPRYEINESLNEKFTEESDPIQDLGIGTMNKIRHWVTKFLATANSEYREDQILQNEPYLLELLTDKGAPLSYIKFIVDKSKNKESLFKNGYALRYAVWDGKLNIAKFFIRNGAKLKNSFDSIELKHIAVDYKLTNKRIKAATRYENSYNNKTKVNEKFTPESDPIKDLGIGLSPGQHARIFLKEMNGNIDKISLTYFGDKNHQGYAYVLYDLFKRIDYMGYSNLQKEFQKSCDNENYWGNRPDIVEDRVNIANVLKKYFNIDVDPFFNFY